MLPKNLKYGTKVESAMAQSYRTNIAPQNGTGPYTYGNNIIINIPTSNNLVLATTESYLKFGISFANATAANVFRWDSCGAHGIIQRIRIFHGSNLLQDIDNYGLLAKMLFDLQVSTDACYGRMNNLVGTRSDLVGKTGILAGDLMSCNQVNSGEGFNFAAAANVGTAANNCLAYPQLNNTNPSVIRYYCLNLISLLGTLNSGNYFPLFACTSAPLRIEIQLVAGAINAGYDLIGNSVITLYNVEYIANFIKLSDSAMSIIYDSLQGNPLQFVVPDYANYQYTFSIPPTGTTQVNFAIAAKYSSLKSIFITVRDYGTGAINTFPYSSVTLGLSNYYFRIGSNIMPTKAPDNYPEMFSEVLKAMGSMSDLNYQPSIEKFSYEQNFSPTGTLIAGNGNLSSGSFYIGLDLENYVSSNKDSLFCGYNSNTDDIFAVLTFGGNSSTLTNVARFDSFAMFDAVIVCESNTCFRRF
jgi:hypothetical protein